VTLSFCSSHYFDEKVRGSVILFNIKVNEENVYPVIGDKPLGSQLSPTRFTCFHGYAHLTTLFPSKY